MLKKICRIASVATIASVLFVLPLDASVVTTDLTGTLTAQNLANSLVAPGGGVTISNVTFTGSTVAAGYFTGGTGIVGFEEGIILSSGGVAGVVGPNNADGYTLQLDLAGDADLDALIPGYSTYDATVLEFDFVPTSGQVAFRYVFTSEEYNEYVNTAFNDVFGFFINGVNYAKLPDGMTVVSINNINNGNPYGTGGSNPGFYVNNDLDDGGGSIDIQADGLTVVLTLTAPVVANATNHMKLAIADAGDTILDSWVFIDGGSLQTVDICGNGLDDEGDGLIDNADPDCQVCSDGDLDPFEQCDDGNIADGDGCSATCTIEDTPPACETAYASPGVLWMPNHKLVPVAILGVTDANGDPVVISVTSIFQDEQVRARGTGNTAPDARIMPLAVRAEREGGGDGRMYYIDFTATAGMSTCSGTVRLCVPHDQRPGGGCVGGGPLYNSVQQ